MRDAVADGSATVYPGAVRFLSNLTSPASPRRTLITLWFGMLYAIVMYYLLIRITPPATPLENPALVTAMTVAAFLCVVASFAVKLALFARARRQDPASRRKGQILAIALSGAAALMGFSLWFATASPRSTQLLALGFCATLLHFPIREK